MRGLARGRAAAWWRGRGEATASWEENRPHDAILPLQPRVCPRRPQHRRGKRGRGSTRGQERKALADPGGTAAPPRRLGHARRLSPVGWSSPPTAWPSEAGGSDTCSRARTVLRQVSKSGAAALGYASPAETGGTRRSAPALPASPPSGKWAPVILAQGAGLSRLHDGQGGQVGRCEQLPPARLAFPAGEQRLLRVSPPEHSIGREGRLLVFSRGGKK